MMFIMYGKIEDNILIRKIDSLVESGISQSNI